MHSRPALINKRHRDGVPDIIKIKRGGTNSSSNSGPAGRKMRPAAVHYRAMAEMAASYGVVNGVKVRGRTRKQVAAAEAAK